MAVDIEVLQVPSELEQMTALYRKRKPKRVLEIGSWQGGTMRVWLTEGRPALVVAVDLEHQRPDLYEEWNRGAELHVVTGSSWDEDVKEQVRAHKPYDWVFIDGDHGDHGVQNDVDLCLPLVRKGGLMLLHDITPPHFAEAYPPGVMLGALADLGYKTWTYQDLTPAPWARGIGVVQL